MIRIENLHIGYTESFVRSETIELKRGNIYVLVGKNGAGKSTLLKTLTREIPLLSGTVSIEEKSLDALHRKEVPKFLAFVPSHFPTVDFLRVEEFIGLGRSPYTHFSGTLSSSDWEMVEFVIQQLGIDHLKGRFTSELSDGEKQLVAIAKAIAQESHCILLDEPTAFLDYPNKLKVIHVLTKVAADFNKCIVFSSHDLELCLEHASSFLVINDATKQLEMLTSPDKNTLISHAFSL